MALQSMTGFASGGGSDEHADWTWELKSVNGRALDVRTRLGNGLEGLEAIVKSAVTKRFNRGSISVHLAYRPAVPQQQVRIDTQALEIVTAAAVALRKRLDSPPIQAEALLAIRGLVVAEAGDEGRSASDTAINDHRSRIAATLETALDGLVGARKDEGARLTSVLSDLIDEVASLAARIAAHPSRSPDAIRARVAKAVARLSNDDVELSHDRLHQEAMLLATRADVEEELQRLDAHVASARELIAAGGAVGRKLDFLSQEFNRETNTICSKSSDAAVTGLALELKSTIDRFREQVQNIE